MTFTSSSSTSSDNEVALCSKACSKAYATFQSHCDKLTNDIRKSQFDVLSYNPGLESIKARIVVYQQNENVFEEDIKLLKLDVMLRDNALVELRKKFEKVKQERDELKLKLDKFQTSSKNLSQLLASQITDKTGLGYDNQVFNSTVFDCDALISSKSDVSMPPSPVHDRYKTREGYHVVPPSYTGTFMSPKPDLVFYDTPTVNETIPTVFNVESSTTKPNKDLSQTHRPSAPITEDWVSDSKDEFKVEHHALAKNLKKDIPKTRGHRHSWNRKACFVCKSLTYLIKDLDYYKKKMGNPQHALKDKGVIDSDCLRHMTGNISYLSDFEEINGGYVAFGGNPEGDKITEKDIKYIVLSSDFKLPDENHVLLRVPRVNNMYNVDLKNIVPLGDLTCLFAKAILDESNLWHRRLGHINFKTINKLVKGKFDGKADEGFLVGYSVSRSGSTWLFDIDTLTKSMNYQPVIAGNQPNPIAGIPKHFDADKAGEGNVQQYVLFHLWSTGSKDPQNTDVDVTFEVKEPESEVHVSPSSSAKTKKHDDKTKKEAKGKSPVELSTRIRNLSEEFEDLLITTLTGLMLPVDPSQYPDDPDMPALEDITYSDDEEDVDGKSASTPIDTKKPLLKDLNGEDVDVYTYISMIGSLMYLTSSRLDIMFVVCACARFHVTPKASHLHAVKRIFSDYARASLDRKSTTG
nr:ribonuclease H-like domain-containing protein [Tanacetum cinerariifolium]